MLKRIIKDFLPLGLVEWYRGQKGEYKKFRKRFFEVSCYLEDQGRFACRWADRYPCLNDATSCTPFEPHYTYHPAWAARILAVTRPSLHVDISSSLSFVAIASAFIPIEFYDFRPAQLTLSNLESKFADILSLPFESGSVTSISCMHVVEHIGLERYGDRLDSQGDLKAMKELARVVAPGGQLLFVVPVGGESLVHYNAHRIYHYDDIICQFANFRLENFSLITDDSRFIENAGIDVISKQKWGCGCFHLVKCS